jgi:hypothetical protein
MSLTPSILCCFLLNNYLQHSPLAKIGHHCIDMLFEFRRA